MAKVGRKPKPYVTSDGEIVAGLAREVDGRWRVVATGQRYTEADEAKAIAKFRQLTAVEQIGLPIREFKGAGGQTMVQYAFADEGTAWAWFRDQLVRDAAYVAKMTGIKQLANLDRMALPRPSIRLSQLLAIYKRNSEATQKTKNEVIATWESWFVKLTGATTLADLTQEKLRAFRKTVVAKLSPATVSLYFGRIRTVLNTAWKTDDSIDVEQINALKVRMKVLFPPANDDRNDPHPISREDFHKLLTAAQETQTPEIWRAMLLMSLNAALYMEDVCGLRWDELDLEAGTYLSRRKKRGLCIRAAVLWQETIEAIKALPRRGTSPYVFVSKHGTRFSRNSRINVFAKVLRVKAKISPDVTWSHLRDGAYTEASLAEGLDPKYARLLAGHAGHGLEDKYVKRNPRAVKPATDAVYAAYFGPQMRIAGDGKAA
jgi:integrase